MQARVQCVVSQAEMSCFCTIVGVGHSWQVWSGLGELAHIVLLPQYCSSGLRCALLPPIWV